MAEVGKTKSFKVDFVVATHKQSRDHTLLAEFLASAGPIADAVALDGDEDEKHQLKSIVSLNKGAVFKGVFGRCRFGEKPVQGSESGSEEDVELKPGHGLVHKNFFIFFAKRNLLVYQRNPTGSHLSKLQRYLSSVLGKQIILEPILTTDAYQRLLDPGAHAKTIELSFQKPRDPALYQDLWVQEAMHLMNGLGGFTAKIRIGVGRENKTLLGKGKAAAVTLARAGLARVARVTIEDESEPIDLIADRIIETINVPLGLNGRPAPDAVYAALANCESNRSADLATFFGK